jgi:transposase
VLLANSIEGAQEMEAMRECCCGIDVHQAQVTVCLLKGPLDRKPEPQIREFSTMTKDLKALRDWLQVEGCEFVAMESTGVYWRPVYNVLYKTCDVTLGNACDIKNKPGRKTDKKDAEWIAKLHRCGMISKSFIAPPEIQELRDVTRYRKKLVGQSTSERNRILKLLESANIKLSSTLSDVFGVSGRKLLEALIAGEVITPDSLVSLVDKTVRKKIPELVNALNGQVTKHLRDMINFSYEHLQYVEAEIGKLEMMLEDKLNPFEKEIDLLDTIPGVGRTVAASILAELGNDMSVFPTATHAASWAGVSPGNNESAGKKKRSKTANGHKWIRGSLLEASWAAQKTRTYLGAKFWSLVRQTGKKKAAVAIAHKILVIAYHILKTGQPYRELGYEYLDSRRKVNRERQSVRNLENLGYQVILVKPGDQQKNEALAQTAS